MPTIIGYHDLKKDTQHWLTSPKREEVFGPLGVTNIRTFVNPQDPTKVAVMMDVPDMDAVMSAMDTGDAAKRWTTTASSPSRSSSWSRRRSGPPGDCPHAGTVPGVEVEGPGPASQSSR